MQKKNELQKYNFKYLEMFHSSILNALFDGYGKKTGYTRDFGCIPSFFQTKVTDPKWFELDGCEIEDGQRTGIDVMRLVLAS